MYLLNSFSTLISEGKNISDIASRAHRIGELLERLEEIQRQRFQLEQPSCDPTTGGGSDAKPLSLVPLLLQPHSLPLTHPLPSTPTPLSQVLQPHSLPLTLMPQPFSLCPIPLRSTLTPLPLPSSQVL